MTKPRTSVTREIYGILGTMKGASAELQKWNGLFRKESKDAVLVKYSASVSQLPERLSEMFHFDRRAYFVSGNLQESILMHMDTLEASATKNKRVNTVLNQDGVLTGAYLSDEERVERLLLFDRLR